MTSAQIIIIVTIVAYLFGMLLIGVIFNRAGAADTSDGSISAEGRWDRWSRR